MDNNKSNDWNEITKEELEALDKAHINNEITSMFGITDAQLSYKKRKFGLSKMKYLLYRPVVVGDVIEAIYTEETIEGACTIMADFGDEFGIQDCVILKEGLYRKESLIGQQILGAFVYANTGIFDEKKPVVYVLGLSTWDGFILIQPEIKVPKGTRVM